VIENTMSNVLIKHNTIRLPSSVGCVNISNQFGAVSNITVEDNVCEGGTYQIFTDTRMTASTITGIIVKDNIHINASWQYGLYAEFGTATMTITGATIIKPPPAGYFN
jgi:polygalacturonase